MGSGQLPEAGGAASLSTVPQLALPGQALRLILALGFRPWSFANGCCAPPR